MGVKITDLKAWLLRALDKQGLFLSASNSLRALSALYRANKAIREDVRKEAK